MFGKPEWFHSKQIGWGLVSVTWRGWLYTASASAFIALPFLFLLGRSQVPEALIWIATSNAVLCWDVAGILWLMKQQGRDNVQLVSHIAPQASHIATRYFDLHLRRRA